MPVRIMLRMLAAADVDLVAEYRLRGAAPLARHAVCEDGSVVLAIPDEYASRAWHMVRLATSGDRDEIATLHVESLRRFEVDATQGTVVGVTDDNLYLFPKGRKSRFALDGRPYWNDIALVPGGERFVAAGVDRTGTGNLLVHGECNGATIWTREIPFPVACVGVDHSGARIVLGGESGEVLLVDDRRRNCWLHRLEAPVVRVAASHGDSCTFLTAATEESVAGVGRIGPEGELVYFLPVEGVARDVAVGAQGQLAAVVVALPAGGGRLMLVSGEGDPLATIPMDHDPIAVSVSRDAAWIAVQRANHRVGIFRVRTRLSRESTRARVLVAEAERVRAGGDTAAAVRRIAEHGLGGLLDEECATLWTAWREEVRTATWSRVRSCAAVGDWADVERTMAEVADLFHADAQWHRQWSELRARAIEDLSRRARDARDPVEREQLWREALLADPWDPTARAGWSTALTDRARARLLEAKALLDSADFAGAVAILEELVDEVVVAEDAARMLRACRVAVALADGHRHYEAREYAAAVFQYRRVLGLDPGNSEAEQRLRFAEKLQGDNEIDDRFSRLE